MYKNPEELISQRPILKLNFHNGHVVVVIAFSLVATVGWRDDDGARSIAFGIDHHHHHQNLKRRLVVIIVYRPSIASPQELSFALPRNYISFVNLT